MIKRVAAVSLSILCAGALLAAVAVAGSPVLNPAALGGMELRFSGNEDQKNYLGIDSEDKLSLDRIRADRLIIVVFNVFCAICQADASVLNSMHEVIEDDPRLKGKTKLLGIATGNTDAEVEQFQQKYQVPFPLFADPEFSLERAIPENLRTPMIIIARNVSGKSLEVVKTHVGGMDQVGNLLGEALSSTTVERVHARAGQN